MNVIAPSTVSRAMSGTVLSEPMPSARSAFSGPARHGDRAAVRGEFDRVCEEVEPFVQGEAGLTRTKASGVPATRTSNSSSMW